MNSVSTGIKHVEKAIVALAEIAKTAPLNTAPDGATEITFTAPAGLYQFSVIADASNFDWEELYITLNQFNNINQRTGPWDFNLLNQNAPLVPSYWVEVDGRRIGLWFFQRVSLEDIRAKRFRGRMAFHLAAAGSHTLRLIPYRTMAISWISAHLETDPEDSLQPLSWDREAWSHACPASRWAEPAFWQDLVSRLQGTHARYSEPLQRVYQWIRRKGITPKPGGIGGEMDYLRRPLHPEDILPLLFLHHLEKDPAALPAALRAVDAAIALPHWGNPKEDGYSHDGDMGSMAMLRSLSWAWHALRDELGGERREALRAKLALQGQRFFDLALLNRDYWGGSVIQDHGHKSLFGFATAALNLLNVLPEASSWYAFAKPRLWRTLQALPRDGAVPQSSYFALFAYMDEPLLFRDTLLALSGEDLFDHAPLHEIVSYLATTLRVQDHLAIVAPPGAVPFIGGNAFLNRVASRYHDGLAAYLEKVALETPELKFSHGVQEHGYYHGVIWGLLTYDPSVSPTPPAVPEAPLRLFEDSALAHYWDRKSDITLAVHSGPGNGYNAYRRARGPCDRMEMIMGPGHFILARKDIPLLVTPDGGYRLRAFTRNCMLIQDQPAHGDIGYPMSIPSYSHPDDEIDTASWDQATRAGRIRLDLATAWPDTAGLARYTRDFILEEGRRIVCRDTVVLSTPRQLEWRFQTMKANGLELEGPRGFRIGGPSGIHLEACTAGAELVTGIHPTEVVYSYSSATHFAPFEHARYTTREPATALVVDFVITWP